MAIAPTFQRYLDRHVSYDVIAHEPTMSSISTAQVCHIPGDCLAKGVVLRDDSGYMLAVLPATHRTARFHRSASATASTLSSTTRLTDRATSISRPATT